MRILQLIQKRQLRGAEIFAAQLSQQLLSYDHDVILVSLFEGTAELPFTGRTSCLNASTPKRLADYDAWKKLDRLIAEFKPDIVQANAGDTLKYATMSKFIFRWKARIIFRNASIMSAFIRGRVHRAFNKLLLSRCAYFISVSENSRADLLRIYPSAKDRSITIPIGTNEFDNVDPIHRVEPNSEPVFINVASFVPEKNQSFLLEVFQQFFIKHQKGYLWLVGDGKLNSILKAKVKQLNLEKRVRFWGYQNEAIGILKAADVFVMPSHIEGIPGAILEALSCGVPIIASSVGGISEIIANNVNGFCLTKFLTDDYLSCIVVPRQYETQCKSQ